MRKLNNVLEDVLDEIENNLKDDIKADTLADDFSLSSTHLQRIFRQTFNRSLGSYIRSRKLSASIADLLYSGSNVLDIALEYGFSYEQSYILSFRRKFGFTPGDIRRNRRLVRTTPSLQPYGQMSLYKNNFLVGNIINEKYMDDAIDWKNHNTIPHENNLKPFSFTTCRGGVYNWTQADQMVNRMLDNGIPVHGHLLVWHDWTPAWMTKGTKAGVEDNLKNYITDILTHYHGRINSWKINKAVRNDLSAEDAREWKKCLRTDVPWHKELGADYIETAYRTAREAAPDITLYYNDNGLDDPNKAEAVWKMINDINTRYKKETGQKRPLIEGLGIESHYRIKTFDENKIRASLARFATLDIELSISELVITDAGYEAGEGKDIIISEHDAEVQAKIYARLFKLYREYSEYIPKVTFWSVSGHNS